MLKNLFLFFSAAPFVRESLTILKLCICVAKLRVLNGSLKYEFQYIFWFCACKVYKLIFLFFFVKELDVLIPVKRQ